MFELTWGIWAFKNSIWLKCVQCLPFLSNFDCPPIIRPALSVATCLACLRRCPQNVCFSRKSTLCVSRVKFFWSQVFFKAEASPTVCTVSGGFTQRIRSAKTGSPSHPLSPIPSPLGHVASAQFCIHVFSVFLYFLFLLFLPLPCPLFQAPLVVWLLHPKRFQLLNSNISLKLESKCYKIKTMT